MTTSHLLLVETGFCLAVLAVTAYFTRPTRRRFLGALAGGATVAVVGVGIEVLFQTLGFWRYPSAEQPYGPVAIYPLVVVVWTVLALVGWRVMRRFGWLGQVMFLAILAILGTLRDYLIGERALGIIILAPGIATMLVDAALWVGTAALAQAVMRIVAGPAAADRLARGP